MPRLQRHTLAIYLLNVWLMLALVQPTGTRPAFAQETPPQTSGTAQPTGTSLPDTSTTEPATTQAPENTIAEPAAAAPESGTASEPHSGALAIQAAQLAEPAVLPAAPQLATQQLALAPQIAADGSLLEQTGVVGPPQAAPDSLQHQQAQGVTLLGPGAGGEIKVNTTSTVIDGDIASVAALLATPDKNDTPGDPSSDDQDISLHEALAAINNSNVGWTVKFQLPVKSTIVITPGTPLLKLEAIGTVIDGNIDADGTPDVMIDGPSWVWHLSIRSSNNVVRGLIIQGIGMKGAAAHSNLITGNYIGTDALGELGLGKEHVGVEIREDAHHNIVENNLIAGNAGTDPNKISSGVGIWAGAHDNIVRNNRIGVDVFGNALPNEMGITIGNTPGTSGGEDYGLIYGNIIGGERSGTACDTTTPCNIIAGNEMFGVQIHGAKAMTNTVAGNYIGLYQDKRVASSPVSVVPNELSGVLLEVGTQHNIIGGEHSAKRCDRACNYITGNVQAGVVIGSTGTSINAVQGNVIGLKPDHSAPANNQIFGITIQLGASENTIGGSSNASNCDSTCNVISGNKQVGLNLNGTNYNAVRGNLIGLRIDGAATRPNKLAGIQILNGATGNAIGGLRSSSACQEACNIISGNGQAGIALADPSTTNNTVRGNYIGLRLQGTSFVASPNGLSGVLLQNGTSGNMIGGDRVGSGCAGACNVISGNREAGVGMLGSGTDLNTVKGNFIGTNPAGNGSLPNSKAGIILQNGPSNTIIGGQRLTNSCSGPCNLISGNTGPGIVITGEATRDTVVTGNTIGRNIFNSANISNKAEGIFLQTGTTGNLIGGEWTPSGSDVCKGPCNLIAGNRKGGVRVGEIREAKTRATIRGNLIFDNNAELAIDLADDGIDHNDRGDSDNGPNDLLNAPSQVYGVYDPATRTTTISGTVSVTSPLEARVEVYGANSLDPSGSGQTFYGTVTPNLSGTWTLTRSGVLPYRLFAATVTDKHGATSEFSGRDAWPTALEVVQVVQDQQNSVKLFAEKPTYVRLHARTNTGYYNLRRAHLWGEMGGRIFTETVAVDRGSAVDVNSGPDRNEIGESFVFEVPPHWVATHGTLKLRASFNQPGESLDAPHETDYSNNTLTTTVTIENPGTLKIRLFRFEYAHRGRFYKATDAQMAAIQLALQRMFPGKLEILVEEYFTGVALGAYTIQSPQDPRFPVGATGRYREVNTILLAERIRRGADPTEYWHGVVANVPEDASVVGKITLGLASGLGRTRMDVSSGTPADPLTAVHEIAHTLGRKHVACNGERNTDAAYPYNDNTGKIGGPLADPNRFAGFTRTGTGPTRARDLQVRPGSDADVMSYCKPKWISNYTYDGLYGKYQPATITLQSAPPALAAINGDFLVVHGVVNTATNQATLHSVSRQPQVPNLPPRVAGRYHIRLFSSSGAQLADYPFTLQEQTEDPDLGGIHEIVPFVAGTRRVAIVADVSGTEIASQAVSANAPTVSISQRGGGPALPATGSITLTWQGSDADGNSLAYSVLYSHNNGVSWSMVTDGVTTTSLAIDVARLPGTVSGSSGRFRVVASDGVLQGSAMSDAFGVPNKAPQVTLVHPLAGYSFRAAEDSILEAFGHDPEDGPLANDRFRWTSNRDGDLGTGALHSARLSLGAHQLTVTATDSAGQTATATTSVTVTEDTHSSTFKLVQEVVERTNGERAALNLPPLKLQDNLINSSLWMAQDTLANNYLTHTDSLSRSADTRIRQFGYAPSAGTLENLAKGQATPADVVTGWMNSPGHRANILNTSIREIGAGYAADPSDPAKRYWVQNFGWRTNVYPVVINREAARTLSPTVSLYIYGSGWAQQMRLSNDGATWSNWETYTSTKSWTLASGSGTRTVYVELRNGTTVLSSSDSIQLGPDPSTPPPPPPPAQAGFPWAWGYNSVGQLGDGNAGFNFTRASVGRVSTLTSTIAIAAGQWFGLAVKQDGTVWAWGQNQEGQLGDGTTISRTLPVQVSGITGTVAVAAGAGHVLALTGDGSVYAWGDNAYGQLGDGTLTDRRTPTRVLSDVLAIAAGDYHSLAIRRNGSVWGWGINTSYQVGVNPKSNQLRPVQVLASGFTAVAAGGNHSLALGQNGNVYSWGGNMFGQLGNASAIGGSSLPQVVLNLSSASQIAAGGSHSLARTSDGSVYAWGSNKEGQIGVATPQICFRSTQLGDYPCAPNPVQVTGLSGMTMVSAGGYASYALTSDKTVFAWGLNGQGQLGDGTFIDRPSPTLVEELGNIFAIAAGSSHAYALSTQATLPPPPPPDPLPAPGTPPAPVVVNNGPWQVRNLVTGTDSITHSAPGPVVAVGTASYFAATTADGGRELWKTNGSAAGTTLVKDIHPGGSSNPRQLTRSGNSLYFTANDGSNGAELWKSDGTAAGTVMVKEFFLGEPTLPYGPDDGPIELTDVNGTLYFVANDGWRFDPSWTTGQDWELWKTDGTPGGTVKVKEIARYFRDAVGSNPRELTNVNGRLFFTAEDLNFPDASHPEYWTRGRELWVSDGTSTGTVLVKDIILGQSGSNPTELTNVNGTLFFVASSSAGRELWKSDGTITGTVMVKDIISGTLSADPQYLTNVNGTLFFTAKDSTGERGLWKSDGTAAGTVRVKNIVAGSADTKMWQLTAVGTTLFFNATDGSGAELWKSDGSETGTVRVKDIASGPVGSNPQCLTAVNSTLFFVASQGVSLTQELWKSNGSEAGTVRVKAVTPTWSTQNALECLSSGNGTLYFAANDGASGRELWKSDGSDAGTSLVKDINAPGKGSLGGGTDMAAVNNTLIFRANDGTSGDELWTSNGTLTGTVRLKDIAQGERSSNPSNFFVAGRWAFFSAYDPANGYELWRSDGTPAGTALIKNISPKESSSYPQGFTSVGSTTFFIASSSNSGRELWKTDGTAFGTQLVKDIAPGTASSAPQGLANLNGTLFFGVSLPNGSHELWKSDGTAAGTLLVKQVGSGFAQARPRDPVAVNGTLFFIANNYELWKSDGTAAGTLRVKDLHDQYNVAEPKALTSVNGKLFFIMNNRELWVSDGSEAGTVVLTGFSDLEGGTIGQLTAAGGLLLFTGNDNGDNNTGGWEVWVSDGSQDGTRRLKDINPGPSGAMPQALTYVGPNSLSLFAASDATTGMEVWRTNGSEAGTSRMSDIAAGATPSNPRSFKVVGPLVFFWANDGTNGDELWALPLAMLTGATPTAAFLEQNGQVVVEAENGDANTSRSGKNWVSRTSTAGYSGTGLMVAEPDSNTIINSGYAATSPSLQYRVRFSATGTYSVWVRMYASSDGQDSLHIGLNNQEVASADRLTTNTYNSWTWTKATMDKLPATININSTGVHTVTLWMREDGTRIDRILLTKNGSFTPSGVGPAESPRGN